MDVKFPLDNYVRYLEAGNELERAPYRDQFLRDVRDRVQGADRRAATSTRPTRPSTACCCSSRTSRSTRSCRSTTARILDDAMRNKIVLCSPLTLYAVLAVVRQAVDNFRLERTSNEILALLGEFSLQWEKYVDAARQGAAALRRGRQGVRGADDDAAPRAATPARQDRARCGTRSRRSPTPTSRRSPLEG